MTEARRIAPYSQPRLSLSVSPQAFAMLNGMKRSGMWGRNRAAVARELIYKGLRELIVVERQREALSPKRRR
jgi:hypothetical protein